MAVYFLDSSALVKRYISEVGSTWVFGLFDAALSNEIFVAAITGVEIIAAITRRSRSGSITVADAAFVCNQFRNDLQTDYQVVEMTEEIIFAGMSLAETQGLRGYDAVQLAAGRAVNARCITSGLPSVIFASADSELNVAATNEGLSVENPNSYP
ncbi:type II toxin-antitoxin system VapC family toxin [Stenomitos frigidus]|uniref:Nucleic acid-binding protein n=1 Tax=Stenomitos frigidus ULC18 TaxID=2107698 RepID=A0A2T1DZA8_9CYAN|nr:type II toxin-antitoxin system VapC family toxin [Stenomitos frigidus]PSB25771.1 nucleic acid-binding protein [Stenomitos frigidus ULC18]